MFRSFLNTHELSAYRFKDNIFPTVEDRTFWEHFPNEECVKIAEASLAYDWPVIKATDFMEFKKSGNRMIMEDLHFDRRNHLVLFALAELKENKGRFLPQLTNGLFAVCEESYWGLSAHWAQPRFEIGNIPSPTEPFIDLFVGETAEQLSMIVKLLEKPLLAFCPEIVARVRHELECRVKLPYEQHFDFDWMGHRGNRVNNWNPWILSNILTTYLLTERDEMRVQRAVKKILFEVQHYYNSIPADGGCDEGPDYWYRAGASLFELLYQLKCATDGAMNFFGDRKIQNMAAYMKKVHVTADYFVNVADAHAHGIGMNLYLLFGFAKETGQEELMNFSTAAYRERTNGGCPFRHTNRTLRRLIYAAKFLKEMESYPVTYPLHGAVEHLPLMELAVLRKGELILSAKGGFNAESHNHNDVGSFALHAGKTPVLVDVGIGTYTRQTFSSERYSIPWVCSGYHNLPILNGREQCPGAQYRADAFEVTVGEISISYPKAYPAAAGVEALTRVLTLTDKTLTVTDRVRFKAGEEKDVTEALMCILPVKLGADEAIIGGRFRLRCSPGTMRCEEIPFADKLLEADWGTDHVNRILISCGDAEEITIEVTEI